MTPFTKMSGVAIAHGDSGCCIDMTDLVNQQWQFHRNQWIRDPFVLTRMIFLNFLIINLVLVFYLENRADFESGNWSYAICILIPFKPSSNRNIYTIYLHNFPLIHIHTHDTARIMCYGSGLRLSTPPPDTSPNSNQTTHHWLNWEKTEPSQFSLNTVTTLGKRNVP